MNQSDSPENINRDDIAKAKRLLSEAIEVLSRCGKVIAAAHAQLAHDMADQTTATLDPPLPR